MEGRRAEISFSIKQLKEFNAARLRIKLAKVQHTQCHRERAILNQSSGMDVEGWKKWRRMMTELKKRYRRMNETLAREHFRCGVTGRKGRRIARPFRYWTRCGGCDDSTIAKCWSEEKISVRSTYLKLRTWSDTKIVKRWWRWIEWVERRHDDDDEVELDVDWVDWDFKGDRSTWEAPPIHREQSKRPLKSGSFLTLAADITQAWLMALNVLSSGSASDGQIFEYFFDFSSSTLFSTQFPS